MRIGVPREKKAGEARVGLTPAAVAALVAHDHVVVVERDAGLAVGLADDAYRAAGAGLVEHAAAVFEVDLVVKVKELQASEYALPRRGSIVLGFQQFAVEPAYLEAALASGATFIACETIASATENAASGKSASNELPVLAAMSRIAGALAPQIGAMGLMRGLLPASSGTPLPQGAGILLGGGDGIAPARVIVIGAGASGSAAARGAAAMGANVTVLATSNRRFDALKASCLRPIQTAVLDADALRALLPTTHLLIGAVLVPGRTSPCLIDRAMLAAMPVGAVFIDIGIDQRGIAATSRMSRIDDPFYVEEGVLHCCIPNLPALVPRSATQAYVEALAPYVRALAEHGLAALDLDAGFARGLQLHRGDIVDARLAEDARQ